MLIEGCCGPRSCKGRRRPCGTSPHSEPLAVAFYCSGKAKRAEDEPIAGRHGLCDTGPVMIAALRLPAFRLGPELRLHVRGRSHGCLNSPHLRANFESKAALINSPLLLLLLSSPQTLTTSNPRLRTTSPRPNCTPAYPTPYSLSHITSHTPELSWLLLHPPRRRSRSPPLTA